MSTRCYIAKELPNGKYKTIYCHHDGYIEYNGMILHDVYKKEKQVDDLLALGNISILGVVTQPQKNAEHTFDKPQNMVCVAYNRDRGEEDEQSRDLTLKEMFKNDWIEFFYIYTKDHKWIWSGAFFNEDELKEETEESLMGTFKDLTPFVEKYCQPIDRMEIKRAYKALTSEEEM